MHAEYWTQLAAQGWGNELERLERASGQLSLFFNGDVLRSGFDNVAFWDRNHIVFVEHAGDTLHTQRNPRLAPARRMGSPRHPGLRKAVSELTWLLEVTWIGVGPS